MQVVNTKCPDDEGYEKFYAKPDTVYRYRIVGMIAQNLPMRFTMKTDPTTHLPFTAIAADSLYIEPIKNVTYIWIWPGERYDIIFKTPEEEGTQKNAIQMRLAAFTQIDSSVEPNPSQMCTIAYLVSGDFSKIDPNFRY